MGGWATGRVAWARAARWTRGEGGWGGEGAVWALRCVDEGGLGAYGEGARRDSNI